MNTDANTTQAVPGADINFFTELRAIIVNGNKPLGNRLQEVDARIALLTGAPQPQAPYREPPEYTGEGQTPLQVLLKRGQRLADLAEAMGLVITIEQHPLYPPAMGHYETVVAVREARGQA